MHHFRSVFRWGRKNIKVLERVSTKVNRFIQIGVGLMLHSTSLGVSLNFSTRNGVISVQIGVAKNTFMLRLLVKDTFRFRICWNVDLLLRKITSRNTE